MKVSITAPVFTQPTRDYYSFICGTDSWVEIEAHGHSKAEWLKSFLALPHGIPSHDTISRLFAALDPAALQSFINWIRAIAELSAGEVVVIDGKRVRRPYDQGEGQGAIRMVSAWASENRLVLGQAKVDSKSNEITAIPQLLKVLDLKRCIVTIDAMGTQTAIAQQIVAQEADYILALKGIREICMKLLNSFRLGESATVPGHPP